VRSRSAVTRSQLPSTSAAGGSRATMSGPPLPSHLGWTTRTCLAAATASTLRGPHYVPRRQPACGRRGPSRSSSTLSLGGTLAVVLDRSHDTSHARLGGERQLWPDAHGAWQEQAVTDRDRSAPAQRTVDRRQAHPPGTGRAARRPPTARAGRDGSASMAQPPGRGCPTASGTSSQPQTSATSPSTRDPVNSNSTTPP
jgi:hypothetical protein